MPTLVRLTAEGNEVAALLNKECNPKTEEAKSAAEAAIVAGFVEALKGLFNDKTTISKQNREGFMGRTAGFDFIENTLWPRHVRGGAA